MKLRGVAIQGKDCMIVVRQSDFVVETVDKEFISVNMRKVVA